MKSEKEIREKIAELEKEFEYLTSFLGTLRPSTKLFRTTKQALFPKKRELDSLYWVINDDLP
jgi:hypothetical protein